MVSTALKNISQLGPLFTRNREITTNVPNHPIDWVYCTGILQKLFFKLWNEFLVGGEKQFLTCLKMPAQKHRLSLISLFKLNVIPIKSLILK